MKRLILYLFSFAFIITSCNDHLKIEKNNDPQGYADSQFIGAWKITAVSSDVAYDWNNDGTTERDIYSTWSACQRDNLFTFTGDTSIGINKKGTFKINCSVTKNGVWQIYVTPTAQYLVYVPDNLVAESEKLISMTSVRFETTTDISLPSGQPATITKTWTRQ